MKTVYFSPALLLAVLGCCTQLHAATQASVILPSPEFAPGQRARAVLIDPFSSAPAAGVFVGLWGNTGPSLLRFTPTDAASSAFNMEQVDSGLSSVFGLAYNNIEGIYAGGNSKLQYTRRDSAYVWTVRKSSHPNTWEPDNKFYFQTTTKSKSVIVHGSTCHDITSDAAGAMFATGWAYNGSKDLWVIRRKLLGHDWETVRAVTGDINMNPGLCSFAGNVFAVGAEGNRWTVLRSGDQGNTWSANLDSWPEGPAQSSAVAAAVDSSGNIYVVGYHGVNGTNPSSWTVRRSSDGGDTWATMLNVPGPTGTAAVGLGIDSTGAVTVSGTVSPDGSTRFWKVVRCTQPHLATAWTEAFAAGILPFGGTYSQGSAVAVDLYGNLFLAGGVRDWTDESNTTYSGSRAGLLRVVP